MLVFICHPESQLKECHVFTLYPEPQLKGYRSEPQLKEYSSKSIFEANFVPNWLVEHICHKALSTSKINVFAGIAWRDDLTVRRQTYDSSLDLKLSLSAQVLPLGTTLVNAFYWFYSIQDQVSLSL
ncbi:hypothetical protein DEO72_LG2g3485 [Vigna unguiculata]|uniref:Uncharacterized protein n=1 Tax=Vigna unguiculata TaxID=3917 RepID=A0A4D6L3Q7_VIGUN|nr:hypothetical protein DEO72_LG2g3485 [Vigna unguiculata]